MVCIRPQNVILRDNESRGRRCLVSICLIFDYYDQKIGYSSGGKFYFSYDYYSSIALHNIDELKTFLEKHPEYELIDAYEEPCDVKELLEMKKA